MSTSGVSWPVDLPQTTLVSNSMGGYFNAIRSTVSGGLAKMRRKYTADVLTYNVTLMLRNQTERTRWLQFVQTDTNGGTYDFDWTDPQSLAVSVLRFVSIGDLVHLGGDVFQVDFQVEKVP